MTANPFFSTDLIKDVLGYVDVIEFDLQIRDGGVGQPGAGRDVGHSRISDGRAARIE